MSPLKRNALYIFIGASFCAAVHAQDLNTIGVPLLQSLNTNLNGAGVRVGQPEAPVDANGVDWEVDPANIPQPVSLFTWFSNGVSSATYPNTIGGDSSHADDVARDFYGATGMATNVAHVDNYDADYFVSVSETVLLDVTNYTCSLASSNLDDAVINQSFIFESPDGGHVATNEQTAVDTAYDNYSAKYGALFVSGAGNGSPTQINPPATCYNGIGVGVSDGVSSVGPTIDNGRCKPDIIAPGGDTSFSTAYVSGSAAVLMQAGWRGDGGSDTNAATNMLTVKALLLNGAVKPSDWTNVAPAPLDFRYGAGVLNVFNSYEQLTGGKHGWNFSTNVPTGAAHPPVATTLSIPTLDGWDFNTATSSATMDNVSHYFFNATNAPGGATFTLTATLDWDRHQDKTNINNLALFLYNAANGNLVTASTSVVDNVQQVFVPQLQPGRYDLQVWKAGGSSIVSDTEPYALAWQIFSASLAVAQSGGNLFLSWPTYPAGFEVAGATNLIAPVAWSTNNVPPPVFTNNQNVIWLGATNGPQFFRLQTP